MSTKTVLYGNVVELTPGERGQVFAVLGAVVGLPGYVEEMHHVLDVLERQELEAQWTRSAYFRLVDNVKGLARR